MIIHFKLVTYSTGLAMSQEKHFSKLELFKRFSKKWIFIWLFIFDWLNLKLNLIFTMSSTRQFVQNYQLFQLVKNKNKITVALGGLFNHVGLSKSLRLL